MLYSKSAEYAIQAMVYLAEAKSEKPVMTAKIAKDYNIPYQFLAKIVQTLVTDLSETPPGQGDKGPHRRH